MVVRRKGEEAVIRRLIEDWASAVRARKIRDVVAHHTDDVVMFDVPPPVAVRGISAYRETWPPFFRWLREGNGTFDIVKLDITADTRWRSPRRCCAVGRKRSWQRTTARGCV
jgi:ketosteroid isomerase-like protein